MKRVSPWLALCLFGCAGCGGPEPVRFWLNMEGRAWNDYRLTGDEEDQVYAEIEEKEREAAETEQTYQAPSEKEIEQRVKNLVDLKEYRERGVVEVVSVLEGAFGTPDEPHVFPGTEFDLEKLQMAAGRSMTEKEGLIRHGLYREHCAHCHGISGDGAGPTARFLNPYPRDYRLGTFKFTSTADGAKPTRADLKRTVLEGIPGTAMPSFALLPDDEVEALVEYVRYLAIRGEMELLLFGQIDSREDIPLPADTISALLNQSLGLWKDAENKVVTPVARSSPAGAPDETAEPGGTSRAASVGGEMDDKLAESIKAGRELFHGKLANCFTCHGPTGLGDGQIQEDAWNKPKFDRIKELVSAGMSQEEAQERVAELWTLPPQKLSPRNLRSGIYRGGRRPVDVYRRIFAGIKGANMPAAGAPPGVDDPKKLKPEQIWNLVDYVRSLPYEEESKAKHAEHVAVRANP